jgi:hypothetical protein
MCEKHVHNYSVVVFGNNYIQGGTNVIFLAEDACQLLLLFFFVTDSAFFTSEGGKVV